MHKWLENSLPKEKAIEQVQKLIRKDGKFEIELDGKILKLPGDFKIEEIGKSFHSYNYDVGFGDHFRVSLAIGGIQAERNGILTAKHCFASAFFSLDGSLISVDFSSKTP